MSLSEQIEKKRVDSDKSTNSKKKKKESKQPTLVNTFFRNGLKSSLDLTALAETKAGILISINGFILTVSVTASSFVVHNDLMTFAFIAIIITSLGSIILAILSVRPRLKEQLVPKEYLKKYSSLLYYQDIAHYKPKEYQKLVIKSLQSTKRSQKEPISHLHILSSEIKQKYHWLKFAYAFFSLGLIISASLMIYALAKENMQKNISKEHKGYKNGKFYNIFEPSGATTIDGNHVLIVEDESSQRPLKLITFDNKNSVVELGDLHIPKKLKKVFKKRVEDLEGVAADKDRIYAITSHSPNRANKEQKERKRLLMMHYEDESITDLSIYKHLKEDLINYRKDLFGSNLFGHSPINIEALAINPENHQLYIGFRAPLFKSKAIIIPIKNPHQLFEKKRHKPLFGKPIFVDLDGLGIRAMHYDKIKKGLWIVAGDSGSRISKFQFYFYDPKSSKVTLKYPQIDFGYSEGLTIVTNNGKRYLFLVEDNGIKPNKTANYIIVEMDKE